MKAIRPLLNTRFWYAVLVAFVLLPIYSFAQQRQYNILSFGAKGDGRTLNTRIINRAIAQCAVAGGGTVIIPEGVFLSGTIYLKSKVNINLRKGAVLKGTADIDQYQSFKPKTDLSKYSTVSATGNNGNSAYDTVWTKALMIGESASHFKIYGEGTIDGDHVFNAKGEEGMRGPHTVILANCTNIKFENINIEKAANYALLAYNVENAVFQGIHIRQGWDGIHIRGGKNVLLNNCELQTGDDAIAGGFWENFEVKNCLINSACNGIRVIMPVNGFVVANCRLAGPGKYPHRTSGKLHRTNMLAGIYIQPGGWGLVKGNIEKVHLHNLDMYNMDNPFIFELHKGNNATNISVENITGAAMRGPIAIHSDSGYHYQNILFRNIDISFATTGKTTAPWALGASNVQQLRLEKVTFNAAGIKPQTAIRFENVTQPSMHQVNVYAPQNNRQVETLHSGVIEGN